MKKKLIMRVFGMTEDDDTDNYNVIELGQNIYYHSWDLYSDLSDGTEILVRHNVIWSDTLGILANFYTEVDNVKVIVELDSSITKEQAEYATMALLDNLKFYIEEVKPQWDSME